MTELLVAFATLTVLEVVLGVDNVIFISILSAKLPKNEQKKARRVGLIAAMLMRIPTSLTIFGYPWIAMLLFLAAAAGGFWMAWTILAGDVRKTRTR